MNQIKYEEAVLTIKPGIFRHFKGNYYEVLCIARHSETVEPMVVYRALYGDRGVWTRPAHMWNENVERDGQTFQRFRRLSRVERIEFYEALFDGVRAAGDTHAEDIERKLRLLDDYYSSGQWRDDYEADEQGLLPADLKRGILSQDALYNMLEEHL